MKRFWCIAFLLFGGLLSGCGGENSDAEKEEAEATTKEAVDAAGDLEPWDEDSETSDPQSPEKKPDGLDN